LRKKEIELACAVALQNSILKVQVKLIIRNHVGKNLYAGETSTFQKGAWQLKG